METGIIHYYPNCKNTTVYSNKECKTCRIKKSCEYSISDKGKIIKEKSIIKQRLARRRVKIRDIALEIEHDMNLLGIIDDQYKYDFEVIKKIVQKICDINLRDY